MGKNFLTKLKNKHLYLELRFGNTLVKFLNIKPNELDKK